MFLIHVIYAISCLYIRSLSVMLSRISVHVLIQQGRYSRGYTTWNYHGEESDDDDDDGGGDDEPFDGMMEKMKQGKQVTAIGQYEICHYSRKKDGMINETADKILRELRDEEANSSSTPAEICMAKLGPNLNLLRLLSGLKGQKSAWPHCLVNLFRSCDQHNGKGNEEYAGSEDDDDDDDDDGQGNEEYDGFDDDDNGDDAQGNEECNGSNDN
nr:myb domain protein 62 [Tanacetum cinerariifolium]